MYVKYKIVTSVMFLVKIRVVLNKVLSHDLIVHCLCNVIFCILAASIQHITLYIPTGIQKVILK